MIDKKIVIAVLVAATALIAVYNHHSSQSPKEDEVVGDLDMTCGFTSDFGAFLKKSKKKNNLDYSSWDFDRNDLKCASFGGKANSTDKISKTPIIFIHGNSDIGFGRGSTDGYTSWQTGFRALATFLGTQGYRKAELYTTTWGPANPNAASQNNHAKKYVMQIRAFVEAVLAYTKAK